MDRHRSLLQKVLASRQPDLEAGPVVEALDVFRIFTSEGPRLLDSLMKGDYWAAQTLLVAKREAAARFIGLRFPFIPQAIQGIIDYVFTLIGHQIRTSDLPPKHEVEFGTSRWRGVLGEDFTFRNTPLAAEAIVNVLKRTEVLAADKISDWEQLKRRGCVIGHHFDRGFQFEAGKVL